MVYANMATTGDPNADYVPTDQVADFLAAMGYGYDFGSDVPLPESLRWPLAHAWWRLEAKRFANGDSGTTPQKYYDGLADELQWSRKDSSGGDQ
jgi:hypothetical protein